MSGPRGAVSVATVAFAVFVAQPVDAQNHPAVGRAEAAFQGLDYSGTVTLARDALRLSLSREDRARALEILAFSYGAMDSATAAVETFKELIFLDPDREPDVDRVSPRITALYASALGQVLVVRRVRVDSASFVAGRGVVPVRFDVSRAARVVTRVQGPNVRLVIDSQVVAGPVLISWSALQSDDTPLTPGPYQLVVSASEGGNEYSVPVGVNVAHGDVDTLLHLTGLPGYTPQPEFVSPPRNWRPLGFAVLMAGIAAGASLALENSDVGGPPRNELAAASVLTLGVGVALSLKRPDPRPVEANIRYNELLREQLAARNAEIVEENARRRQQVRMFVTPRDAP